MSKNESGKRIRPKRPDCPPTSAAKINIFVHSICGLRQTAFRPEAHTPQSGGFPVGSGTS